MAAETAETSTARPQRADAKRNRDKLIVAARAVFADQGTGASLEAIAKHAGVGIGTLYRNFPTRHELLEAVYLEQAHEIADRARELAELEPWEALSQWLHEYVGFATAKRALADDLFENVGRDAVFQNCGGVIIGAAEPLLTRAQEAGVARPDVEFLEAARMIGGIANIANVERAEIDRMVDIAIDGLRFTPTDSTG